MPRLFVFLLSARTDRSWPDTRKRFSKGRRPRLLCCLHVPSTFKPPRQSASCQERSRVEARRGAVSGSSGIGRIWGPEKGRAAPDRGNRASDGMHAFTPIPPRHTSDTIRLPCARHASSTGGTFVILPGRLPWTRRRGLPCQPRARFWLTCATSSLHRARRARLGSFEVHFGHPKHTG